MNEIEIAPFFNKMINWSDAFLYVQFLNYDGHNDWRFPTNFELQKLPRPIRAMIQNEVRGIQWYDLCWASDDVGKNKRREADELFVIAVRDVIESIENK